MKTRGILLYTALFLLGTGFSPAQNTDGETKAYNEKVTVTAPYQPTLGALSKPSFVPGTVDTALGAVHFDYQIISKPFATSYPIENIKPAKILGEPIPKLFNNSVKVGFGNHLSPLAELNFGIGRSRQYELGVAYRHHSAFGNVKGYDRFKTNHSLNEANVIGRIFADKFVTTLDLFYQQRSVNCYGFRNTDSVPEGVSLGDYANQPKRWYQNARGTLTFTDNATSSDELRFDASVDYNLNMTNWRSLENTIAIEGGVSQVVLENRKSADVLSVGGRMRFEDNTYRDGIKDGYWGEHDDFHRGNPLFNAYHLNFQPTLYYKYDFVELNAALVFHVFGQGKGDLTKKFDKFQFNPEVDLKLHIIDKIFTFFIGTGGGLNRNTVEHISEINPFLHPLLFSDLKFTRDKFNAYAGLSGNFSRNIDYRIKVSAHFMEDVLSFDYYRYDYSYHFKYYGYNDFIPMYSGDVFNLRVLGELNFRWGDKILAHIDATYSHYNQRLYYTPEFMANLSFRYNIVDKVSVYTTMKAYSNMKARNRMGQDEILKGCFDWSIGAEYRFIKRMTAFVDLNNIIAQRYFRWYDYPSYRFNFMVGLTFDF